MRLANSPPLNVVFILVWLRLLFTNLVEGQNAEVPAELLAKALNYAASSPNTIKSNSIPNDNPVAIIQSLEEGNIDTLYAVANSMNAAGDHVNSILIWHALADGPANHILSMVQLGFSYAEEHKTDAIKYFVQAGEDGPHQSALYNAGRLFLEMNDYTRALAYIRAAATLGNDKSTAMYAKPKMTQTAKEAYEKLSEMIITDMHLELDLQDMVNIFAYGSMDDFPQEGSKEYKLWDSAMQNLGEYMTAKSNNPKALEKARDVFSKLQNSKNMSRLQAALLSGILAESLKMIIEEL